METTGNDPIKQLFDQLDQWRHLPAYQLERRADIFFSLYLPEVLQKKFDLQEPAVLIPEFPCRIGTVYANKAEGNSKKVKSNQSFKIDYLALGVDREGEKVAYLVELKTDNASINHKQLANMVAASSVSIQSLIEAIPSIHEASHEKNKYTHLIDRLNKAQGTNAEGRYSKEAKAGLVFIVPASPTGTSLPGTTIDFEAFANHVNERVDPIANRFAESLNKWATTKAGTPL